MDSDAFIHSLKSTPNYRGQIVHQADLLPRPARYAPTPKLSPQNRLMLDALGIGNLYTHQSEAVEAWRNNQNPLIVTGTASGKSLCYLIPIIETLHANPSARVLLLFPTKALTQDQHRNFQRILKATGLTHLTAGVCDGDTPASERRRLRDTARVIFTNPDMLHAAILPQHARWEPFLSNLKLIVVDELHTYSGIFGANAANLFRRLDRVLDHYHAAPQVIAASATIGNPEHLARTVLDKPIILIEEDGSPRARRTFLLWNPPVTRNRTWRSRRSANVEAHELMARLVINEAPTITFSKCRLTAEMIHRYTRETLQKTHPHLANKITPYRGGYLPEERRAIEQRLFNGELLGVSTTPALELGIDIGALEACIIVGYPGTLASFFQQAGRAGRKDRPALTILIGLDTTINQYIMTNPDYLFGRPLEDAVIDRDNACVVMNHLRCATHELPLPESQIPGFGPNAPVALDILGENRKLRTRNQTWHHVAVEVPQHEITLRAMEDANVLIEDAQTGAVMGEVSRLDAPVFVHPGAIHLQNGETWRVEALDLEKNVATARRENTDYYTQALGGSNVHHVDHQLREKPFGIGKAAWGEVTTYDHIWAYDCIRFYELDAISRHLLDLPTTQMQTQAFWVTPPENLMQQARDAGLDPHRGLQAIGYATRMILPLYMTCDTRDFSHSIGSANSAWHTLFIYERYPLGLGYTHKAYEELHRLLPQVHQHITDCGCEEGCPCCVGKPLRQEATWNTERHEGTIPSKAAALYILEHLLAGRDTLDQPDTLHLTASAESQHERLRQTLRRRLEAAREARVFHHIEPHIETEMPPPEAPGRLETPDVAARQQRGESFHKQLRKRLAKKDPAPGLSPHARKNRPPAGIRTGKSLPPHAFAGRPEEARVTIPDPLKRPKDADKDRDAPVATGDPIAARARKRQRKT